MNAYSKDLRLKTLAANATRHSIVRSLLLVGWKVSVTHRKELRERDDDRRRETGCQGRGDLGRGHTPRHPRGGGPGPSWQTLGRVECAHDGEGLREPAPLG